MIKLRLRLALRSGLNYHLTSDPHGKPDDWYDYDGDAKTTGSANYNTEQYWQQYQSNAWLDVRFVQSGAWMYKIDFGNMNQANTSTMKARSIRRHLL